MSGKIGDEGQLALMDAMVFFVAAIAVSGVLVSSVETSPSSEGNSQPGVNVDEALAVILHSSLGSDIEVLVGGENVTLSRNDAIVDCLLLEAHAIAEGDDVAGFVRLNLMVMDIMTTIFMPYLEPSFRLLDTSGRIPIVLVSIPSEWPDVQLAYAAGAKISDASGGEFLVQLRSVPVSPAHL